MNTTLWGGIKYNFPKPPPDKEIMNYELPTKKQKWVRPKFPTQDEFDKLSPESQVDLVVSDMNRRRNGMWFFNNGTPTYITGDMYFYLTHWFINAQTDTNGYPEFRQSVNKYQYFLDAADKSPNCLGVIAMTSKRVGKTEIGLSNMYNRATNGIIRNGLFGMNALTSTEAKERLFKNRIMRSHRRIPKYLRPESNDDLGTVMISSNLTFTGDKNDPDNFLNNVIDWRATKESAYQGTTPKYIYVDEFGSIEEMDTRVWKSTTQQQCALGGKINGKMYLPATLEELKGEGALYFKELFYDSFPDQVTELGRTKSWLWNYFVPYWETMEGFVDEYGNFLEAEARKYIEVQYEVSDEITKAKLRRQYPPSVEAAFDVASSNILENENILKVKQRIKDIRNSHDIIIKKYNLFEYQKEVQYEISQKSDNALHVYEDVRPGVQYIIGCDPTQTSKETVEQGSKFAFTVLKGYDHPERFNFVPVAYYEYRPAKMEQAYQMLYLTAKHYGKFMPVKVLGESNVGQGEIIYSYFKNKGFGNLIVKTKNKGAWVTRDAKVKEKQFQLLNKYIERYYAGIPFDNLLEQLLLLEQTNTDLADSFLMCLLQLGDIYDTDKERGQSNVTFRPAPKVKLIRDGLGRTKQVWEGGSDFEEMWFKE
jgi:hypothetical protein